MSFQGIDSFTVLQEVGKLSSGYHIAHFKENRHTQASPKAPAHHYVVFYLPNQAVLCCNIITSQVEKTKKHYLKQYPAALKSLIDLPQGIFPFCTKEASLIDCFNCQRFSLKDLQTKLDAEIGFKVKLHHVIDANLATQIKKALLESDCVPEEMKPFLP